MNKFPMGVYLLAAIALYWVGVSVLDYPNYALAINMVRLLLAVMVVVHYGPEFWRAAWSRSPRHTDMLISGIVLAWAMQTGFGIVSPVARSLGYPFSYLETPIAGMFLFLLAVSAIFHLVAPGVTPIGVTRRTRYLWALGLLLGGMSVGLVLGVTVLGVAR